MGFSNRERMGALALLLLTSGLIAWKFGEYLRFPQGKVIEPYGDGFKAYMSPAYHAEHDSTYTHFEGMNYPYGDHLVFSDPQPLITNLLKLFKRSDTDVIRTAINWTHGAMLASILLCGFFLYLIFLRLRMPVWYSVPAAAFLSFLAPMLERIGFHYGLAQPAAIPAVLYLLMLHQEKRRWALSLGIGATVLFFSLFHFQYFGLFALGLSLYVGIDFLYMPQWRRLPGLLLHYALQVLLPFAALTGWLALGHPVDDRSAQPYGFLPYRAHWEGIFASPDQPHYRLIHEHLLAFRPLDLEARNYIGLVATAWVCLFLFHQGRSAIRRLKSRLGSAAEKHPEHDFWAGLPEKAFLQRLFGAGALLLLFALGFPFILPGMEGLIEYLGPLRQFRALGRFSWLFFFTANIGAFAWLAHRYKEKAWVLGLCLAILAFETFHFVRAKDLRLDEVPGLVPGQYLSETIEINPEEYQALLPAPFFHLGSDNFWVEPEGFIQQHAMVLAMQTGLPLTGAMLSRTSLSQTIRQLQLVTEPYRLPAVLDEYPNRKPLLLLRDEQRFRSEAPRWDHFSAEGTDMRLLHERERLKVFAVPLAFFRQNIERRRAAVLQEIGARTLFARDEYLVSDSLSGFVLQRWEDRETPQRYWGSGGYTAPIRQWNTVFDAPLPDQAADREYVFSVWMYVNEDLRPRTYFTVIEFDPQQGKNIRQEEAQVHSWARVFDRNGWALIEYPFRVSGAHTRVNISFHNPIARGNLLLDELLIRPAGTDVYRETKRFFWKNNRFYLKE